MEETSKTPSQARRAILKGSLAAPVVLTVSSPTAAASSFARCLANTPSGDPGATRFISDWDQKTGYWRLSVPVVQFANANGNNKTPWLFDDPKLGYVSVDAPFTTYNVPNGWLQSDSSTRWMLAWFDNDGNLGPRQVQYPSPYKASTVSCHTSFNSGSGK